MVFDDVDGDEVPTPEGAVVSCIVGGVVVRIAVEKFLSASQRIYMREKGFEN